ncbi:beta strand repeat-containing protein, partial [Siculibacillus lacustris]|uniref:beta strand repeat-containing protein n=1 Tax=Siculibacillus lacustris TaxID=1549641 RepID=UPI0019D0814A
VTRGGDFTTAAAQTLVDGLTYGNGSVDPTAGARVVTLTSIRDSGGSGAGSVDTTALSAAATVTVTPVNDAPTLAATVGAKTFTEGGAAVALWSGVSGSTIEAGQTFGQIRLTVSGLSDGVNEQLTIDGSAVTLTNGTTGTTTGGLGVGYAVSVTGSTATVTLTGALSGAQLTSLLQGATYRDLGNPTAGDRVVTLTSVKDSGGTANGGVDTTTSGLPAAETVTVARLNHAPTLTTTAETPTFVEKGGAVSLFSGTAIGLGTGDGGQTIRQLVLTVSSVSDGAAEQLTIDGTAVALVAGTTTTSGGATVVVTVAGSTATLTVTRGGDFTTAAAQTLVDGLTYGNGSVDPTAGARVVTLTSIRDSGGSGAGSVDTTALSAAATVTVTPVNDVPTLAATVGAKTFTEGGAAVALWSGVTASTIEAGQTFGQIRLTVSELSDGVNEQLTLDGSAVTLTNGTTGTTTGGLGVGYAVSVTGGTATVTLTGALSGAQLTSLLQGATYRDLGNPTAGDRVVTLTSVKDSGGTANGGVDTTTSGLPAAETVTVARLNHAPTLTTTAETPTFVEKGGAVSLFSGTAIGLGTGDGGQTIRQLVLTVSSVSDG